MIEGRDQTDWPYGGELAGRESTPAESHPLQVLRCTWSFPGSPLQFTFPSVPCQYGRAQPATTTDGHHCCTDQGQSHEGLHPLGPMPSACGQSLSKLPRSSSLCFLPSKKTVTCYVEARLLSHCFYVPSLLSPGSPAIKLTFPPLQKHHIPFLVQLKCLSSNPSPKSLWYLVYRPCSWLSPQLLHSTVQAVPCRQDCLKLTMSPDSQQGSQH